MKQLFLFLRPFFLLIIAGLVFLWIATPLEAKYNPLSVENNRFGIHILESSELDMAAKLVNSYGGDWGYVSIVIRSDDRDVNKWQRFFHEARSKHLIPIVRIATRTREDYWEKPQENDAVKWANFLSSLKWPTNNHYIVVYNEPNHAKEWGNTIDPASYAKELDKTMAKIREKDEHAFLLNAGFDAAAPTVDSKFMDQVTFMEKMNEAVPGIFQKIDGWASHPYPQPNFVGSVNDRGRNTVTTYKWELDVLKDKFSVIEPAVFITETGWAHRDGIEPNTTYLSEEVIASNFSKAFQSVWTDRNIIAVTPFTLHYNQKPFDHFSWLRPIPGGSGLEPAKDTLVKPPSITNLVLGIQESNYVRLQFLAVQQLPKQKGQPVQTYKAALKEQKLPQHVGTNQLIHATITLENTGEAAWFSEATNQPRISVVSGNETYHITLPPRDPVLPGESYKASFDFLSPTKSGSYTVTIQFIANEEIVAALPYNFTVSSEEIKESLPTKVLIFIGQVLEGVKEKIS